MQIELPNDWAPRPHQLNIWKYMLGGGKRASLCWHRQSGKDDFCLNWTALAAHMRVGNYWYMTPHKTQVRTAIWESTNHRGQRRINQAFPLEIRKRTLEQEMMIELLNGSMIKFLGSDSYDRLVGSRPIGLVFSEWSLCDPKAWSYLSPILSLRENQGWALFPYTPRGINHGYDLHTMAMSNDDWYAESLTVEDTTDELGNPLVTQEQIAKERNEGKPEHEIRQEFYCEFLSDTDYQLIPMGDIVGACKRDLQPDDPGAPTLMGYDVGLSGDPSVRVIRVGRNARTVPPLAIKDKTFEQQAEIIVDEIERYKPDKCFIDSTGIGHGLYEMVKAKGYKGVIVPVNFGANAANDSKYANKRAEMYDKLSVWFRQDYPFMYDSLEFRRELSVIRYDPKAAKVKIEGKAEIKKRLAHSCDYADALALTFAGSVPRRDSQYRRRQNQRAVMW